MDLKNSVTEVVEEFCDSLELFTSLDVSNVVKINGFPHIRHREVSVIVRDLFGNGLMDDFGYIRSTIEVTVENSKQLTFLYHHQSSSPDLYTNRNQMAIPPTKDDSTNITKLPLDSPLSDTLQTDDDEDVRKQKSDCRLEVPASWVKRLDWKDGATVYAVKSDKIILKNSQDVNINDNILVATTITDGRLRVPKTAFVKAGFQSGPNIEHSISLDLNSGTISVEDV